MHIRTASVDYQLVLAHVGSSDALIVSSQKKSSTISLCRSASKSQSSWLSHQHTGFFLGGGVNLVT